jgi:hypothetical protein
MKLTGFLVVTKVSSGVFQGLPVQVVIQPVNVNTIIAARMTYVTLGIPFKQLNVLHSMECNTILGGFLTYHSESINQLHNGK